MVVRPSIKFTIEIVKEIAIEMGLDPPASSWALLRPKTIAKQMPSRTNVTEKVKNFLR